MNRSVTAKFLKALSLVLLLFTCTNLTVSAKELEIDVAKIRQEYERAKHKQQTMAKQMDCLTRNVYYEAGSEPFEGKLAVAQVTINRVQSGKFPNSVCGVVYQKDKVEDRTICQFSWFCEDYQNKPVNRERWVESREAAKKVLMDNVRLPKLGNALYFHNDTVSPKWGKPKVAKIGRHIFYSERRK